MDSPVRATCCAMDIIAGHRAVQRLSGAQGHQAIKSKASPLLIIGAAGHRPELPRQDRQTGDRREDGNVGAETDHT